MSEIKYESFGDGDLTPEQLGGMDMWDRDVMLDERHRVVGAMLVRRAVAEILRHRATMKRLEEMAAKLESQPHDWPAIPREHVAAVLRSLTKGV